MPGDVIRKAGPLRTEEGMCGAAAWQSLPGRWAPGKGSPDRKRSASQEHNPTFLGKVTLILFWMTTL